MRSHLLDSRDRLLSDTKEDCERIESNHRADEVYRRIRMLIIEGKIPEGTRIDRKALADDLGVSLTPVNVATARLLGERFLERRNGTGRENEGLFVPERPTAELVHVFAVRAGIEGIAARLCVERAIAGESLDKFEMLCASFSEYRDRDLSVPFTAEEREIYLDADKNFTKCSLNTPTTQFSPISTQTSGASTGATSRASSGCPKKRFPNTGRLSLHSLLATPNSPSGS